MKQRKWTLFLTSLLLTSGAKADVTSDICTAIKFHHRQGGQVSSQDLYHCHVVTNQSAPSELDWTSVDLHYRGLVCHAHEWDGLRKFSAGEDNVNIFVQKHAPASFLGLNKTVTALELKRLRPALSGDASHPKLTEQFNFFQAADPECKKLENYKEFTCGDFSYCIGFARTFTESINDSVAPPAKAISPPDPRNSVR